MKLAAKKIDAVREIALACASGESLADVGVLTRALLAAVRAGGEAALVPLWAACRLAGDDPLVRRALSFIVARDTHDLEEDRWIPILDLLAPPHPRDVSTLLNTLTALQHNPNLAGLALRTLRREIGTFLEHTLRTHQVLADQVIELLRTYQHVDRLGDVLTKTQAKVISELLQSLEPESAPPEGIALGEAEIRGIRFPDEFSNVAEDLKTALVNRPHLETADDWSKILHWTDEGVAEFLERYVALEELTAVASAREIAVHGVNHSRRNW